MNIEKINWNDLQRRYKKGNVIIKPLKDLENKDDLSPKWGEYVLNKATQVLGKRPECIIYGKDKDIFKCLIKIL